MTDNTSSVSVVIPMFNSATTIERALESVSAQSRPPHEVIVVDDGSIDTSTEVVEQWSNLHFPVRLIKHAENHGPSASRNTGWDIATGKFVAFLDADDAWHPEKLRIQTHLMESDQSIGVSGHQYDIGNDLRWTELVDTDITPSTFSFRDFLIKNRLSTPTVMLRREIPLRFARDQRFSEDYRMWMEIVCEFGSASFINLPLTRLFKAPYGKTGLSGNLRSMYFGELNTYSSLRKNRLIKGPIMILCMMWSTAKYLRRNLRMLTARK